MNILPNKRRILWRDSTLSQINSKSNSQLWVAKPTKIRKHFSQNQRPKTRLTSLIRWQIVLFDFNKFIFNNFPWLGFSSFRRRSSIQEPLLILRRSIMQSREPRKTGRSFCLKIKKSERSSIIEISRVYWEMKGRS